MALGTVTLNKTPSDILFVSESLKSSMKIVAYDPSDLASPKSQVLQTESGRVNLLRTANGGGTLVAAAGNTLVVGALKQNSLRSVEDLVYDFYSLNTTDEISCLSIRHAAKKSGSKKKASHDLGDLGFDLAIGCARGAIFVYADLLTQLQSKAKRGLDVPKKQHWHRKAVHSVAWSNDGRFARVRA